MSWVRIGILQEFRTGVHRRETPDADVLVVVLEGEPYAFEPTCPHGGGSLIECEIAGRTVRCPLHGWTFDLQAEGRETHGFRGLRTYSTRVVDGVLEVNCAISADATEMAGGVL